MVLTPGPQPLSQSIAHLPRLDSSLRRLEQKSASWIASLAIPVFIHLLVRSGPSFLQSPPNRPFIIVLASEFRAAFPAAFLSVAASLGAGVAPQPLNPCDSRAKISLRRGPPSSTIPKLQSVVSDCAPEAAILRPTRNIWILPGLCFTFHITRNDTHHNDDRSATPRAP